MKNKKIIVAPLNWGLGHATRCIPIIKKLLENHFIPILASDGAALAFLRKEFHELETLELPSYNIQYSSNLKSSLFLQSPKILKAIKQETKVIDSYLKTHENVVGIISDNRFGVYSKKIPSVYITHQINVLSGLSTSVTSKIHQSIIKKFDECWIPDLEGGVLSGKLSQSKLRIIPIKYIGVLSRFSSRNFPKNNNILIILSGPEPNRTQLEEKLLKEFKHYKGKILLVQGRVEQDKKVSHIGNIMTCNYMLSDELEREIHQSELIICRSGYSSIMDLAKLGKKVFFIPTRNQNEQEYLATYLEKQQIAPFAKESDFKAELLEKVNDYNGFEKLATGFDTDLLHLFKCK